MSRPRVLFALRDPALLSDLFDDAALARLRAVADVANRVLVPAGGAGAARHRKKTRLGRPAHS